MKFKHPVEKDWTQWAKNNMYDHKSLVTWDDIFLAYDIITKDWVIGKVLISKEGITTNQNIEIEFYSYLADSLERFKEINIKE